MEEGPLSLRFPRKEKKNPRKRSEIGGGVGREDITLSLLGKQSTGVSRMRDPLIPVRTQTGPQGRDAKLIMEILAPLGLMQGPVDAMEVYEGIGSRMARV